VQPTDKLNNFILGKVSDAACSLNERQFAIRIREKKPNLTYFHTLHSQDYWTVSGDTTIEAGDLWYHIVMIYDGSTSITEAKDRIKVYVNGNQYDSYYHPLQPTSSQKQSYIKYGHAHFAVAAYLKPDGTPCAPVDNYIGDIDDIRIYSRALNEDEIECLYQGCATSGVKANEKAGIAAYVYPNPSENGIFNLKFSLTNTDAAIQVNDIQGKLITASFLKQGITSYKIDLSAQPKGVYVLSLRTNSRVQYFKLVKE
jgi:hypothetical protein